MIFINILVFGIRFNEHMCYAMTIKKYIYIIIICYSAYNFFFKLTTQILRFMFYLSCYFLNSSNFKFTNFIL